MLRQRGGGQRNARHRIIGINRQGPLGQMTRARGIAALHRQHRQPCQRGGMRGVQLQHLLEPGARRIKPAQIFQRQRPAEMQTRIRRNAKAASKASTASPGLFSRVWHSPKRIQQIDMMGRQLAGLQQ